MVPPSFLEILGALCHPFSFLCRLLDIFQLEKILKKLLVLVEYTQNLLSKALLILQKQKTPRFLRYGMLISQVSYMR